MRAKAKTLMARERQAVGASKHDQSQAHCTAVKNGFIFLRVAEPESGRESIDGSRKRERHCTVVLR